MKRLILGVVAIPVAGAAVLAVEVEMARRGPDLADAEPYDLDGLVGSADGARPPVRMTWLGDSTAAGVGASSAEQALPRQVARRIGRAVELTVLAVSGDRVSDVLDDQVDRVASDAEVVVIDIGSNDVTHLTSKSSFRSTYGRVLDRLPKGARVVLLGVPDFGAPPRLQEPLRGLAAIRGRSLDAVVEDLAADRRLAYVDIAGETGPSFRRDTDRYFSADDYHPSDDGYRLWADATVPVVEAAIGG